MAQPAKRDPVDTQLSSLRQAAPGAHILRQAPQRVGVGVGAVEGDDTAEEHAAAVQDGPPDAEEVRPHVRLHARPPLCLCTAGGGGTAAECGGRMCQPGLSTC